MSLKATLFHFSILLWIDILKNILSIDLLKSFCTYLIRIPFKLVDEVLIYFKEELEE